MLRPPLAGNRRKIPCISTFFQFKVSHLKDLEVCKIVLKSIVFHLNKTGYKLSRGQHNPFSIIELHYILFTLSQFLLWWTHQVFFWLIFHSTTTPWQSKQHRSSACTCPPCWSLSSCCHDDRRFLAPWYCCWRLFLRHKTSAIEL